MRRVRVFDFALHYRLALRMRLGSRTFSPVKLRLDNLPASLQSQRQTLAHCFEAMDWVMPLRAVYLFGSHARGEAGPDSDVDFLVDLEPGRKKA